MLQLKIGSRRRGWFEQVDRRKSFLRFAGMALAWSWTASSSIVLAQQPQGSPSEDAGVFSIVAGERRIGTEKFKITPIATGFEATGEIQFEMPGSPRTSETSFLRTDDSLRPTSYQRQQKLPKKGAIFVQFGSPESKLTSETETGSDERIFYFPDRQLVVLDTNFFHHFAILLRHYASSRRGLQRFNVFVPQEATPGMITLELLGQETLTVGTTTRELNHYEAVTDQVKIGIWADSQGKISRISIPQASLEVVRQ